MKQFRKIRIQGAKKKQKTPKPGGVTAQKAFVGLLGQIRTGNSMGDPIITAAKELINELPKNRQDLAIRYLAKAIKEGEKIRESGHQPIKD